MANPRTTCFPETFAGLMKSFRCLLLACLLEAMWLFKLQLQKQKHEIMWPEAIKACTFFPHISARTGERTRTRHIAFVGQLHCPVTCSTRYGVEREAGAVRETWHRLELLIAFLDSSVKKLSYLPLNYRTSEWRA